MPLIEAENTFALSAVIVTIVALGMWAERQRWGQRLGGPLLLLAATMALANLGVIPHSAPLYDIVSGYLVPVAIPLLLMRADFRTIFVESGPVFVVFLIATVVTVIGALIGVALVDIGPLEPQIVGTITSSYIGGSINFVATAEAVGIKDSSIYVAALSADAVGAVFFLFGLMMLPAIRFVRLAMPSKYAVGPGENGEQVYENAGTVSASPPFDLVRAANGLGISLVVCAVSTWLSKLLEIESGTILTVTTLSVLVANFAKPLVRHVATEFEIGTLFMYMFFACLGAGANLGDVVGAALPILMFIVVMVTVHLVLMVIIGKLLRLDLAEMMIASNACILGPATAAALAAGKGWQQLVAPGILTGIFGYAIATFIGVALTALLGM